MKQMALPLSPLPPRLDDRISPSGPVPSDAPRNLTERSCCTGRSAGTPLPAPAPKPRANVSSFEAPVVPSLRKTTDNFVSAPTFEHPAPSPLSSFGSDLGPEDGAFETQSKRQTLARLRAVIQRIEGGGTRLRATDGGGAAASGPAVGTRAKTGAPSNVQTQAPDAESGCSPAGGWRLGAPEVDRRLGVSGLVPGGVHEIKPLVWAQYQAPFDPEAGGSHGLTDADQRLFFGAVAGAAASAFAFALRLAARRVVGCGPEASDKPVLLCSMAEDDYENGALYGPALAPLGLDATRLIKVRVRRLEDALWTIEEALRSQAVSVIIARLDEVLLTPARRLSLAAQDGRTPCLIVSGHDRPGMAATMSRWRVGPALGWPATNAQAMPDGWPGRCPPGFCGGVYRLCLERCRSHAAGGESPPFFLEWCHETLCFRVVSALADGAAEAGRPRRCAG